MNVRQRKAAVDARVMVIAQEQVAVIFAMPKEQQPSAWAAAAIAVVSQGEPKEVVSGCKRVFETIANDAAKFK